jgi:hypothetical protein
MKFVIRILALTVLALGTTARSTNLVSAQGPFANYTSKGPSSYADDLERAVIARIQKYLTLLKEFNKENKKLQLIEIKKDACYFCNEQVYRHELVILCTKKISAASSLDPVFETWDLFWSTYPTLERSLFLYEFSLLIFSLYNYFFAHLGKESLIEEQLQKIIELQNRVRELPIQELHDSLEKCYDQLLDILNDYGPVHGQSWQSWVITNWWVPPVLIGTLVYSMFYRRGQTPPPATQKM